MNIEERELDHSITIKFEKDLYCKANKVLKDLDIDMDIAFGMFLKQIVELGEEILDSNKKTKKNKK